MTWRHPAIFLAFLCVLCVSVVSSYSSNYQTSQTAKIKDAKKLFKQRCIKCHGADGTGNTTYGQTIGASNLTDPEWQDRVEDKRLLNVIKHGRGQMPAFGEKLTDDQIDSLMLYVRTLKKLQKLQKA